MARVVSARSVRLAVSRDDRRRAPMRSEGELDRLRDALRSLLASGRELDDPRMDYVVVQVDRVDIECALAALGEAPPQ